MQLTPTVSDLERRLELALLYYMAFRPHEGLGGATPLEAFSGTKPAHENAVEPPRGRPDETCKAPPFHIAVLDQRRGRFPILTAAA